MSKRRVVPPRLPDASPSETTLAEFFALLDRANPGEGPRMLQFDLARDAATELFGRQAKQIQRLQRRLDRMTERAAILKERHRDLLRHLPQSSLTFQPAEGEARPGLDEVVATYSRLRQRSVPVLVHLLHVAAGGNERTYLQILTEEVLDRGSHILTEYLLLHSAAPRTADEDRHFTEGLCDHLAGKVNRVLAHRGGYQVTPEVGAHLATLIRVAVAFLRDVWLSEPPLRLLFPDPETPFDPDQHERLGGRSPRLDRIVSATLFPGLVHHRADGGVIARARVSTRRHSPPDTSGR